MSLSRGYTFGATEQVTNAKLHTLVDSATISSIVDADISAAAAIAESKINFDGSVVCKLGTTQTVTGNKTFSTLTNIYNMIGSLASINTISAVNLTGNLNSTNLMVGSMASLSYIRNTQINTNLICASLASVGGLTVGGLTVGTINGSAYPPVNAKQIISGFRMATSSFNNLYSPLTDIAESYSLMSSATIMPCNGYVANTQMKIKTSIDGADFSLIKNNSVVWMISTGSQTTLSATYSINSLCSFTSGDIICWKRHASGNATDFWMNGLIFFE